MQENFNIATLTEEDRNLLIWSILEKIMAAGHSQLLIQNKITTPGEEKRSFSFAELSPIQKELFRELNLYEADLRDADLRGAKLSWANLGYANLRGANLYGADLYEVNLREADLYEANLYEANLQEANLYGANLQEADLRRTNLYGANLSEAKLGWTNLSYTNLREADLYEANLYGANLRGTKVTLSELNTALNIETIKINEKTEFYDDEGELLTGVQFNRETGKFEQADTRALETVPALAT